MEQIYTNTKDMTEEQKEDLRNDILEHEDDYIAGLLDAAAYTEDEVKIIEIRRKGRLFFKFSIHPISEETLNEIRKKYTKYAKNRRQGIKIAEELDTPKYRASIIYNSTVDSDKAKLWDNPKVKKGLEQKGRLIVNALDVIEATLLPGEKDRIMDIIDEINGYNSEDVQTEAAKN